MKRLSAFWKSASGVTVGFASSVTHGLIRESGNLLYLNLETTCEKIIHFNKIRGFFLQQINGKKKQRSGKKEVLEMKRFKRYVNQIQCVELLGSRFQQNNCKNAFLRQLEKFNMD